MPRKGRRHTEAARAKMVAAVRRGHPVSAETKAKQAATQRRRMAEHPEFRESVSRANRGHPPHAFTAESRRRMSESARQQRFTAALIVEIQGDDRSLAAIAKEHGVCVNTIWRMKKRLGCYADERVR